MMTHHLVHDPKIWEVMKVLVVRLKRADTTWISAADLLTGTAD